MLPITYVTRVLKMKDLEAAEIYTVIYKTFYRIRNPITEGCQLRPFNRISKRLRQLPQKENSNLRVS